MTAAVGIDVDDDAGARPLDAQGWSAPGNPAEVAARFADFAPPARALIGAADHWLKWALFDRPPGRPRRKGPVTLLGEEGQLYAGYDGSYRSEFSSNPSPSIYTWIDGYSLSNFRIGFRSDNGLNIYAWVRNAFDEEYFDQLNFGPSNTGLIAGIPGDPRTWGGTIRYEF